MPGLSEWLLLVAASATAPPAQQAAPPTTLVEEVKAHPGGVAVWWVIQGKRFFHPGDSVLTEEHLSLKDIDVLFVSPTVHNMHVDRSMILINHLEPSHIFPQHFGTYRQTDENAFWTRGYPDELKQRLSRELQDRYHKLEQGEMFVIP